MEAVAYIYSGLDDDIVQRIFDKIRFVIRTRILPGSSLFIFNNLLIIFNNNFEYSLNNFEKI